MAEPTLKEQLEKIVGKGMGWTLYDKPDDYKMTPFGGMWVGEDGKTGHIIADAPFLDTILSTIAAELIKGLPENIKPPSNSFEIGFNQCHYEATTTIKNILGVK